MLKFLVVIYFLLSPFYIFESGGVQPSHAILLVVFVYYFLHVKKLEISIYKSSKRAVIFFIAFVVYVVFINNIVSMYINNTFALKYNLFYIFNFMVFILFLDIFTNKKNYINIVFNLLGAILIIQTLLMVSGVGRTWQGYQHILFFNNPHQLGYYSLLVSSLILLISAYKKTSPIKVLPFIAIALFLSVSAVSISAALAILSGMFFYLIRQIQKNSKTLYLVIGACLLVLLIFGDDLYNIIDSNSFSAVEEKFNRKTTQSGGWAAGRGYDTIFYEPQYLLFGMGEVPGRFHNELHSILGNILRSYGFIGLSLLLIFGYSVFKQKPLFVFYYFIPILIYGLAHNGIRQPFMWIYLAVVIALFNCEHNEGKKLR